MPDISDADFRRFAVYETLGSPDEIRSKRNELEKDNAEYRTKLNALELKVIPDGHVAVPKADADKLPAYKELGKPEDVKAALTAGTVAAEALALASQRTAATAFGKAVALADEAIDTLVAIPQLKDATFSVKRGKIKNAQGIEVDGDIGYITLAGDNQPTITFADAQAQIPALKGLRMATSGTPIKGMETVPQGGENGGTPDDVFARIRANAAKKVEEQKVTPAGPSLADRLGMQPV